MVALTLVTLREVPTWGYFLSGGALLLMYLLIAWHEREVRRPVEIKPAPKGVPTLPRWRM